MSEPKRYEIRTLTDIYKLPTAEAMERCLKELSELMVSSRAMAEMLTDTARHLAKTDGKTLPEGPFFTWPESAIWIDDGGIVGSKISFADPSNPGETLATMAFSKEA